MPFDALMMRAIESRFSSRLLGATCVNIEQGQDRWLMTIRHHNEVEHLLLVLSPGVQRFHASRMTRLDSKKPLVPWLKRLLPFSILDIYVPPFERVMILTIEHRDDWNVPVHSKLVVELAGHLTNLILLDANDLVVDAWRKIAPGRPGRAVFPKKPYIAPPMVANPLETHHVKDLPPWAHQWIGEGGSWDRLLEDFSRGFPEGAYLHRASGLEDIWVYPRIGFETQFTDNLELSLDAVFFTREIQRQEDALRHQLVAQIDRRLHQLAEKLADYQVDQSTEGEASRQLGDLWLTYQYAFKNDPTLRQLEVFDSAGQSIELILPDDERPSEQAAKQYRQFKKIKARQAAMARIVPLLTSEQSALGSLRQEATTQPHPLNWYKEMLKSQSSPSQANTEHLPYRRFLSRHGLEIWVGRNRDENAHLTFRKARPDDLWFHAKQAPGSHVILASGKSNPDLEDVLDAAQLAVFFSSAKDSSNVPIDYTRRKFVRKRPHAEPGQVLYQREKTLYITPDEERLKRLGAMSEKLIDG